MNNINQPIWVVRAGPLAGEIDPDYEYLPGIRCGTCGKTWGVVMRIAINVSKSTLILLRKEPKPTTPERFAKLMARLHEVDGNDRWLRLRPGTAVGCAKIKNIRKRSAANIWFAGYGPIFVRKSTADVIRDAFLNSSLTPQEALTDGGLQEIMPTYIDMKKFGAIVSCEECGLLDYGGINSLHLQSYIAESAELSIFCIPGGYVVNEEGKIRLQQIFPGDTLTFRRWEWPS